MTKPIDPEDLTNEQILDRLAHLAYKHMEDRAGYAEHRNLTIELRNRLTALDKTTSIDFTLSGSPATLGIVIGEFMRQTCPPEHFDELMQQVRRIAESHPATEVAR